MTGIFLGTQKGDMKFGFLFHITFIPIFIFHTSYNLIYFRLIVYYYNLSILSKSSSRLALFALFSNFFPIL